MKILSIRQPWASLIAHGLKDIENRAWRTNYRGPVFIHASRLVDCELPDVERKLGIELPPISTPIGGIVAITNIIDCVRQHDSRWFGGPFGFVLAQSKPLPFLAYKGSLGLRDAPSEVVRYYGLARPPATPPSVDIAMSPDDAI